MTVQTEFATKEEAAEYARCSVRTIERAVHSRKLNAYGATQNKLFRISELDKWIMYGSSVEIQKRGRGRPPKITNHPRFQNTAA